ncbi:hypothetical protein EKG83_21560 [Saccharothrix syringae]|uniref:Uncharacterized protein n=2 Tax=Saccharothrix syringae TaxID=103733 RepID=A0A5Q0H1X1_SACSY|nr:hypothetical protein EKG83_21560 [Saccharothrix syringae]
MREFPGGEPVDRPSGEQEDGALLLLGTSSDDHLSTLRAGEAMSAVLLEATNAGLATCPLSQPLEVAATRDRVRDGLLSPRRPVDGVVEEPEES